MITTTVWRVWEDGARVSLLDTRWDEDDAFVAALVERCRRGELLDPQPMWRAENGDGSLPVLNYDGSR